MIIYPEPLKKGDTIGITATSSGVTGVFEDRLDLAIKNIEALGYTCKETKSVRRQVRLVSNTASERVKEFMSLYLDDQVKVIIPPWGGEYLMDILPLLDFDLIRNSKPKWIMGFSDTSSLLFTLTTRLGIASAHGPNALDFGCLPVDESVYKSLDILSTTHNKVISQKNSDLYQRVWPDVEKNPHAPYQLTEKTQWLCNREEVHFQGRLIGGCLDILCKLLGTPFSNMKSFMADNNEKGFVLYLESCEMGVTDIYRTLLQLKLNGWFEHCNGILYGRLEGYSEKDDYKFIDIFNDLLEDIPLIYGMDIGHVPPQITLINGAFCQVSYKDNKGIIKQQLI